MERITEKPTIDALEDDGKIFVQSSGAVKQILKTDLFKDVAVNTLDNPFNEAYWKDSVTGNVYIVKMVNGVMTATKYDEGGGSDEPDTPLEDLLPDRLLIWHDEFDGTEVDFTKWGHDLGVLNATELQYYTDDVKNTYVENSILHLKAIRENYTGKTGTTYEWTSGKLHTNDKFEFKYGRVEAKIKMQRGTGSFPAFWMVGSSYFYHCLQNDNNDRGVSRGYPWSSCGEIDIAEQFGNTMSISTAVHFTKNVGKSDIETKIKSVIADFTTGFHIIALERNENSMSFYLDGNLYGTYTPASAAERDIFNKPFFIILNNAVGSAAGTPADTATEFDFQIDWVRYYAPESVTEHKKGTGLALSISSITLPLGTNKLVDGIFTPDYVDNMTLTWSTSDESIATCYGGYIRTVAQGSCVVTAKDAYGHSISCNVTVAEKGTEYLVQCEEIEISNTELTFDSESTATLYATLFPADCNDTVTWTSSDTNVASVSSEGVVTGIATGTCVITATSNGHSVTCNVTCEIAGLPHAGEVFLKASTEEFTLRPIADSIKDAVDRYTYKMVIIASNGLYYMYASWNPIYFYYESETSGYEVFSVNGNRYGEVRSTGIISGVEALASLTGTTQLTEGYRKSGLIRSNENIVWANHDIIYWGA